MFHSLFQKYLKIIDRYIVVIALLAILCGVVGQYMMSWDLLWAPNIDQQYISEYADSSGKIIGPLEPLARGLKVVGGYDSYAFHVLWKRFHNDSCRNFTIMETFRSKHVVKPYADFRFVANTLALLLAV